MGGGSPCWARPRPWPEPSTIGRGWDGCWPGWPWYAGSRETATAAWRRAGRPSRSRPRSATEPCRRKPRITWGRPTMTSANSAGRLSCGGRTWKRRTGRLARPGQTCGSCTRRGWHGPWVRSGPSPRAGATGRRRSASPCWQAEGSHRDVLELLRQRGRVTYRALNRQFHLDDDVLDDLKEELIKAQRVAVDENGDVLVWVGDVGSTPAPPPPSPQPVQRPTAEVDRAVIAESPAAEPRAPEAERRQLTVLFCDLVDSTAL